MKQEQRSLLAVVLSVGVLMAWFWLTKPAEQPAAPVAVSPAVELAAEAPAATPLPAKVVQKPVLTKTLPAETTTIENERYIAQLTNDGAVLSSLAIKGYYDGDDKESPLVNLAPEATGLPLPLDLQFLDASFAFPETPRFQRMPADEGKIRYVWEGDEVTVSKTIAFHPQRYVMEVEVEVVNTSNGVVQEKPFLRWSGTAGAERSNGFFSFLKPPPTTNKQPMWHLEGSVERDTAPGTAAREIEKSGTILWAGLEDRYFLSAIIPRIQANGLALRYSGVPLPNAPEGKSGVIAGMVLPKATLAPGERATHHFTVYAGPKEIDQLKVVGADLEKAIDYGWFSIVALPILYLLKFFYQLVHNYGVAIILLTVFIKLLLHPISKKSMQSMKAMQKLQPEMKVMQEKYKNDKARLNQETMLLFRRHKVNPAGGCLPMLLQLPIYIALYKVLWNSIELYHAPFFWFYKDLSAPDPYLIGPILLGIFMVLQQKMMPTASADPVQQKMMMLMPVMFSAFMLFLPAGLVVYILVNTVMSVAQQWMANNDIRLRDLVRGRFTVGVKA